MLGRNDTSSSSSLSATGRAFGLSAGSYAVCVLNLEADGRPGRLVPSKETEESVITLEKDLEEGYTSNATYTYIAHTYTYVRTYTCTHV